MAAAAAGSTRDFLHPLPPYPEALRGHPETTCFCVAFSWLTANGKETPTVRAVRELVAQWFADIPKDIKTNTPSLGGIHWFRANMRFLQGRQVDLAPAFQKQFKKYLIEQVVQASGSSMKSLEKVPLQLRDAVLQLSCESFFKEACPSVIKELNKLPEDWWVAISRDFGVSQGDTERLARLMVTAMTVIFPEMIKAFELTPITWKPTDSYQSLVGALQNKGPIIVSGNFGLDNHFSAPVKFSVSLMGHEEVWGWNEEAELVASNGKPFIKGNHPIIIVGAMQKKQRLLYFDPRDGLLYAISFRGFLERLGPMQSLAHSEDCYLLNQFGYQATN